MKALRIHGPLEMFLEEVPEPELQPDEVLIRVGACGICTTDIELYNGTMPYIKQGLTSLPLTPGHEWSGVVAEAGSDVVGLAPGTMVVGDVSVGCGNCPNCMKGLYHICDHRREVGIIHYDGGFAEYVKMPARNVYRIPAGVTLEEAALVEPAATAAHGVMITGVKLGDKVAVFGDGSIGILCAQAARANGASKVVVVARKADNRKLIEELGLRLINTSEEDLQAALDREFGGKADVVFEATGNADVLANAISATKVGGKICGLSITGQPTIPVDIDYIVTREITFVGSLASPNAFAPTLNLIASGQIKVKPLISKTYPLAEGADAFDYVYRKLGPRIKVLVTQDIDKREGQPQ